MDDTLPTFIIGGAAKCATTSLAFYLGEHPDVCISEPKECHFFDTENDFTKGTRFYARYFRHHAGERAVGDATPAYLHGRTIARRIAETLPDVRLVFLFRDPVTRTYSNYWHAVRAGRRVPGFLESLDAPHCRHFVERSRYARYLRVYLNEFGPDRIRCVLTERLRAEPREVLADLYGFLGVDPSFRNERVGQRKNVQYVPRSLAVARFQRRHFSTFIDAADSHHYDEQGLLEIRQVRRRFDRLRRMGAAAIDRFNRKPGGYPPLDEDTARIVGERFVQDNEEFARLTGLDIDRWWKHARAGVSADQIPASPGA